jgi:glycine cleavage system H protein
MDPSTLRYTRTHEWARAEGDLVTVGITKFATDQMTDITYVELPHLGDHVFAGQAFGEVETVKAVNDLFAPADGEVVEVNEKLVDDPTPITQDPYGAGWLIKVRLEQGASLDHLLTHEQYQKQVQSEAH